MRVYKFRAWNKLTKQMQPVLGIDTYEVILATDESRETRYSAELISNYVIMQYTEQKDKTGREIYDGDILAFDNGWHDVVRFERGAWRWNKGHNQLINWHPEKHLTIIGNIYENIEFIEA